MATTRIKDLSKTATTVNSDANLVLDGNTGGTQKITRDNFRQDTADAFVAAPGTYNLAPINSGTGKIDATYLPTSSDTPKGAWNASTNTPTLADGSGTAGDYYDVTVAGSSDLGSGSITFTVGDVVKYNGTTWFKIDSVTNILDGVSTIDGAKAAIEIPDVGTSPQEVPLNGMLGSMAYQDADSVSVAKLEVTDKVDGNLGINTSPTATLEVTDATTNVAAVRVTRRSDLASTYLEMGTSGGSGEVRSTDNLVLSADPNNDGGDSRIQFKVDGSEKWTINSSGNLVANSTGIDFGSGATLDAYEEGSHTTTVGVSGSGSVTMDSSFDRIGYTIIGDSVGITGLLKVSSVSSPVGALEITLPTVPANFTESGAAGGGAIAYYDASALTWSNKPFTFEEGSSTVSIKLDASTLAASDQIRLSFVYFQV
jgi:hypothetical protein